MGQFVPERINIHWSDIGIFIVKVEFSPGTVHVVVESISFHHFYHLLARLRGLQPTYTITSFELHRALQ
jgi:hypothetical protein